MSVIVVGAGYVGLPLALHLARHQMVHLVERDPERVTQIREDHLPAEWAYHWQQVSNQITIHRELLDAPRDAEAVICCVGTPSSAGSFGYDLDPVKGVAEVFAEWVAETRHRVLFVMKSTVPPQTNRVLIKLIEERLRQRAGSDPRWAYAAVPEFLREGHELVDLQQQTRRPVVGTESAWAYDQANRILGLWSPMGCTPTEAELIKMGSNAALALRVAFANEIAWLAKRSHCDGGKVLAGIKLDERIGPHYLQPGPGFAGPCLPKDLQALIAYGRHVGADGLGGIRDPHLLAGAQQQNAAQMYEPVAATRAHFRRTLGGDLQDKRVVVWGAGFKPGCGDVRTSRSILAARLLARDGAHVVVFDEHREARDGARAELPDAVTITTRRWQLMKGAHALLIFDRYDPFVDPDGMQGFEALESMADGAYIYDARDGISDPRCCQTLGLVYEGVGRPKMEVR